MPIELITRPPGFHDINLINKYPGSMQSTLQLETEVSSHSLAN